MEPGRAAVRMILWPAKAKEYGKNGFVAVAFANCNRDCAIAGNVPKPA